MLPVQTIAAQLPFCLEGTDFPSLGKKYEGKVRDNYTKDGKRFIVVTDRISAFDRILCLIPFKGQVLNQMAQFWFENTQDIVGNHVISFPDPNVVLARECTPLPVEMVVRGYITGVTSTSLWYHYERGERNFCGNALPEGLRKNQKLSTPIITPSTKAAKGGHDESVGREEVLARTTITPEQYDFMAKVSLQLYQRGVEIAAKQGIILADTKYEFGLSPEGEVILIDEIHTPDSSRFWFADEYDDRFARGDQQKNINKEYLREWLSDQGFIGEGEIPAIPDDIKVETARRYIEAFEVVTGQPFVAEVGPVLDRIKKNCQV